MKVRKKKLAIMLEKLEGFKKPKIWLEQYVTPASLASEIVMRCVEDLKFDSKVIDLGCGTGIFSIAFEILGYKAIGFDIDLDAIKIARTNAIKMGVNPDFVVQRVEDVSLKTNDNVVVMNPPFGIKRRYADRPFIEKALEIGRLVYSVHSAGSEAFINRVCKNRGFKVTHVWKYLIPLKKSYSFHEKEFKQIAVEVYRIEKVES